MKGILIFIFCSINFIGVSQSSLKKESNKDSLMKEIVNAYHDSVELVIPLSEQLLSMEQVQHDSTLLIRAVKYRGRAHRKMGNYVPAIASFKQVYSYATNHKDSLLIAESADQIGIMNTFMGNMAEGQKYLLEVAELYSKVGSKSNIAGANNGLAIFYNDMGQTDKAIDMYNLSLQQYEEIDDTMGRANIHANLGMLYVGEKKYALAENHILMQGKLDTLMKTQWGLGFHHDYMGVLRRKQGKYEEALKWYQSSLRIREELPSHYNIAESRSGLSATYLALGQFDEAIKQAQEVLRHKEDHQSLSQQISAYSHMAKAYEKKGNYKEAISYQKEYKIMSDSIYQRDMLSQIADKDALYQGAKKDEEIAKLDAANLISQGKIRNKNKVILLGGLALGMISILLFFLCQLLKKVSKQKNQLEGLVSEKDLLLREIHHRVKNNLQLVSSLLTLQGRSLDNDVALQAINEGKSRVRSMALIHQDLYSKESLTDISVKHYIEKLTQELFDMYQIDKEEITLAMNIQDMKLDVDTLIPLGLIINELITNSLKYAFPNKKYGSLVVRLHEKNKELILIVEDDGIGYNPEEIREHSFGNTLINALSEQLGGAITLSSTQGTSTQIVMSDYYVHNAA